MTTVASCHGTNWLTTWSPIAWKWALPTSSSCRFQNTPMIHPGDTRRPGSTRRARDLANQKVSPVLLMALIGPVSGYLLIGFLPIFPLINTVWSALTALHSMSTKIRAKAFIPIGTPRSTTSDARKLSPSSSIMRCFGLRNITSMDCGSMRSPRCSISTIRARMVSGYPTRMAGAKTLNQCISCAK